MSPENRKVQSILAGADAPTPLLIGDTIHVLNQQVHKMLVTGDRKMLTSLVRKQLAAGAQALAVNLGPGREMGRLTPWVVDTIRDSTDRPLFFSANIIAQKQVLQVHGKHITINAVTANHDDLIRAFAATQEYGSSLVVLLVRSGKVPAGIEDRVQLASEVLEQAMVSGLPPSRLYLDPVLTCRPDPVAWHVSRGMPDIGSVLEAISFIKQLDSSVKTIVALGNGSEGMAREKRSDVHGRMLSLLAGVGLDAALLNCLDSKMMRSAEGILSGTPLHLNMDEITGQVSSAA